MQDKNSEAPECANTNRASIENIRVGNIDMNIVTKKERTFQNFTFNPVMENGSIWLTSTELAKALGYKKTDAISQIYARNSDEFTSSMTMTLNMSVNGINNSLRNKVVRVYSLRGCHLIAMFATTVKAKEFRRWVLDILDREVAQGNVNPAFDFETYANNARVACKYAEDIYGYWIKELNPALRLMNSPLSTDINEKMKVLTSITTGLKSGLCKAAKEKGIVH